MCVYVYGIVDHVAQGITLKAKVYDINLLCNIFRGPNGTIVTCDC